MAIRSSLVLLLAILSVVAVSTLAEVNTTTPAPSTTPAPTPAPTPASDGSIVLYTRCGGCPTIFNGTKTTLVGDVEVYVENCGYNYGVYPVIAHYYPKSTYNGVAGYIQLTWRGQYNQPTADCWINNCECVTLYGSTNSPVVTFGVLGSPFPTPTTAAPTTTQAPTPAPTTTKPPTTPAPTTTQLPTTAVTTPAPTNAGTTQPPAPTPTPATMVLIVTQCGGCPTTQSVPFYLTSNEQTIDKCGTSYFVYGKYLPATQYIQIYFRDYWANKDFIAGCYTNNCSCITLFDNNNASVINFGVYVAATTPAPTPAITTTKAPTTTQALTTTQAPTTTKAPTTTNAVTTTPVPTNTESSTSSPTSTPTPATMVLMVTQCGGCPTNKTVQFYLASNEQTIDKCGTNYFVYGKYLPATQYIQIYSRDYSANKDFSAGCYTNNCSCVALLDVNNNPVIYFGVYVALTTTPAPTPAVTTTKAPTTTQAPTTTKSPTSTSAVTTTSTTNAAITTTTAPTNSGTVQSSTSSPTTQEPMVLVVTQCGGCPTTKSTPFYLTSGVLTMDKCGTDYFVYGKYLPATQYIQIYSRDYWANEDFSAGCYTNNCSCVALLDVNKTPVVYFGVYVAPTTTPAPTPAVTSTKGAVTTKVPAQSSSDDNDDDDSSSDSVPTTSMPSSAPTTTVAPTTATSSTATSSPSTAAPSTSATTKAAATVAPTATAAPKLVTIKLQVEFDAAPSADALTIYKNVFAVLLGVPASSIEVVFEKATRSVSGTLNVKVQVPASTEVSATNVTSSVEVALADPKSPLAAAFKESGVTVAAVSTSVVSSTTTNGSSTTGYAGEQPAQVISSAVATSPLIALSSVFVIIFCWSL